MCHLTKTNLLYLTANWFFVHLQKWSMQIYLDLLEIFRRSKRFSLKFYRSIKVFIVHTNLSNSYKICSVNTLTPNKITKRSIHFLREKEKKVLMIIFFRKFWFGVSYFSHIYIYIKKMNTKFENVLQFGLSKSSPWNNLLVRRSTF